MTLTIHASPYRATLTDTPAGVEVHVYHRGVTYSHKIHHDTIDAPFHVVADSIYDMLHARATP